MRNPLFDSCHLSRASSPFLERERSRSLEGESGGNVFHFIQLGTVRITKTPIPFTLFIISHTEANYLFQFQFVASERNIADPWRNKLMQKRCLFPSFDSPSEARARKRRKKEIKNLEIERKKRKRIRDGFGGQQIERLGGRKGSVMMEVARGGRR